MSLAPLHSALQARESSGRAVRPSCGRGRASGDLRGRPWRWAVQSPTFSERHGPCLGGRSLLSVRSGALSYGHSMLSSVAKSRPTPCDPMGCSPPGSSGHGILQARTLSGLPFSSPEGLPDTGIEPLKIQTSLTWMERSLEPDLALTLFPEAP